MSLKREYDKQWDRWYVDQDTGERYAGVTSVLNVLNKEGVNKAKAKKLATYLADNRKEMAELTKAVYLARVKTDDVYLDDWRVAREVGTAAHQVLENILDGKPEDLSVEDVEGWSGPSPVEWVPKAWEELNEQFDIKPYANERFVVSDKFGYAGTYDNAWWVDGKLCIVDAKTNAGGPRGSVAVQNCAYAMAEEQLVDGERQPNLEFEGSYVFWMRPEGWNLFELQFDNEVWYDFRAMIRAYQYLKVRENRVIGEGLAEDGLTFRRWF